jgi:hypothetical protein
VAAFNEEIDESLADGFGVHTVNERTRALHVRLRRVVSGAPRDGRSGARGGWWSRNWASTGRVAGPTCG